jgi:hypothetical protein
MILIWSRWGLFVPVIAVAALVLAAVLVALVPLPPREGAVSACLLGGFLGGVAIQLIAHRLESQPPAGRDEGPETPEAGHFCFIQMRYWSFIVLGVGVVMAILCFADVIDPSDLVL